jgi:hypothetical protein
MPFAPIVASAVLDSLLAAGNTIASQPQPATNQALHKQLVQAAHRPDQRALDVIEEGEFPCQQLQNSRLSQ